MIQNFIFLNMTFSLGALALITCIALLLRHFTLELFFTIVIFQPTPQYLTKLGIVASCLYIKLNVNC